MAQTLAPSELKSGNSWKAPTESSWLHGPPVIVMGIDANGRLYQEKRTSNNTYRAYDVPVNGQFAPEIGEGVTRGGIPFSPVEGWRDGIRSPAQTEYVQSPPFMGAYESLHEHRVTNFHPKDTPVLKYKYDFLYDGPMDFAGKAMGNIQTERQKLANFKATKEMESLASVLKSEGYRVKEFEFIGVEPSGRAIYAVKRVDGSIALVAAEDAHKMIEEDARYYGIPSSDLERLIMAEEIAHRARDDIESIEAGAYSRGLETGAKTNMLTSQRKVAEGAKGDPRKGKEQRRLQRMAEVMEEIVGDVPERYSKDMSYQKNGDREYSSHADRRDNEKDGKADARAEKPDSGEAPEEADAGN